ncbi:transcription antitermination factor NusB [Marisediminicola senii]|uniref:transcription antitermination factor NusB n=1 Tax=Marisediminicola senii TaxID=2711233 RepID=UPI0013EB10E7|nr:transcription antitermination factor NusB [Marisediminicola senii]
MSARSKARKRALDILYVADVRGISINDSLSDATSRALIEPQQREASWNYAREIVLGVVGHGDEIDELIETYSQGWTIARMPAVDRAILRIGIWELLFNDAVPAAVAISEAVDQARSLSTEDSGKFVNGLLASVATSVA